MQILVDLVAELAWPVTTLVIFFCLKTQIGELIGRMRKLKHGDTELAFDEQLLKAAEAADDAGKLDKSKAAQQEHAELTRPEKHLADLAKLDPLSAILAAWVHFTDAANAALRIQGSKRSNSLQLIRSLEDEGLIETEDAKLLNMIREMRNDAAHNRSSDITPSTAWKVCRVLIQLADELANVGSAPRN